ncbi:predicted protein [Phaeodactylum tricornutum CCAP 1055/1]|uniref:Arrestin C-terminal-like domain-containing protein n=2 Tax=Phaeodactylum tricornutum TaxID=2850 RepID=B7S4I4_PHATC|nr:predicted protein [Phaeodactylum tricornutum CCAP 1055/1]EEC42539.1 predicted protein [Phaeodactylum tricornutum CCAP 1055/1]|eukprot:XP_002176475.1 predicted protein [Phaeodactylum tricornutum CCAP 1055/1]
MENKATFTIALERNDGVVRAQAWLKGTVLMEVHETLQKPPGSIEVKLVGKEMANDRKKGFHLPLGSNRREKEIFGESRVLQIISDKFEGGSFSYPFSIYLPASIPPSMVWGDKKMGCKIKYILHASIDGFRSVERELRVVGPPLSSQKHPFFLQPTVFPLKSKLKVSQGYVILAVKLEDSHLGKGGNANVSLSCRNKSSLSIEKAQLRLTERIEYATRQGTRKKKKVLGKMPDVSLSGLVKHTTGRASPMQHEPEGVDGLDYVEMQGDLSFRHNTVRLPVPFKARCSYKGDLINISHQIEVTLLMKGKTQVPKVRIPVKIFDPPVLETVVHSPSQAKIDEVATTMWPRDDPTCVHSGADSTSSCGTPSIQEELTAKERTF